MGGRVLLVSRDDLSVNSVDAGVVPPSAFGGIDDHDQPQMLQVESYKAREKVRDLPIERIKTVVLNLVDSLIHSLESFERQGEGVLVLGSGQFARHGRGVMISKDRYGEFSTSRVQQIFEVTDAQGIFKSPVFVVTTQSGSVYAFASHGTFLP